MTPPDKKIPNSGKSTAIDTPTEANTPAIPIGIQINCLALISIAVDIL